MVGWDLAGFVPPDWGGLALCFQLRYIPIFKNFCGMLRVPLGL